MNNKIVLNEGTTYEFLKRYEEYEGRRFVISSAWQGNMSYSANRTNSVLYRTKMKAFGLEVLRVVGSYPEMNMDIECMISFIPKDMEEKEALRFYFYYGKWFNQNGFFYVDENDILWIISTRQDSTFGGYGHKMRGRRFIKGNIEKIITDFCSMSYVLDRIKVVTD